MNATRRGTRMMRLTSVWSSLVLVGGVVLGTAAAWAQDIGPVKMDSYDFDMATVVLPPDLTEVELEGRHLFVMRCAACHTLAANSYGPRLDQDRVRALGDDGVRTRIAMGSRRMPGFRHTLSSAQVDLVLAYIKRVAPARDQ